LLRDDVFRLDDFRAVARPPRAPAARTVIVPRPLVRDDELREDDDAVFRAVTRPPLAPARFFCAVEPARPPFAPAAFTVIDPRPREERDDDDVLDRDADALRVRLEVVDCVPPELLRERDDAAVVFFRDEVPPPREELELRDDELRDEVVFRDRDEDEPPDDDDFVSPDCDRCLLTVRAAISFDRLVERPCFFSESLMCSYCRSRFALHDFGMRRDLLVVSWAANTCPQRARIMRARSATASTSGRRHHPNAPR
jgi:hypothetical protein